MSGDYVLGRIRAGVLERTLTDLMDRIGVNARMKAEGQPHDAFNLADGEKRIRIDVANLTGKQVVVYGQTEVTRGPSPRSAGGGRGVRPLLHPASLPRFDRVLAAVTVATACLLECAGR